MSGIGPVLALLVVVALGVNAQERIPAGPQPGGPTFEVASIKRVNDVRANRSVGTQPGGRWQLSNMAIAPMIRTAYPSDTSDIVNAPDWVMNETYDVMAKAAGEVSREQMELMLRALLAERFKLAVHYEIQERPVYALVLARGDGRLGPDIRKSDLDCEAIRAARKASPGAPLQRAANGAPACGMSMQGAAFMTVQTGGQPIANFASSLSGSAGRQVVDKTGLTGNYEITLRYSERPPSDATADAPPAIFTALQEQLGLKLEPDRAPLRILVLDHIERPTED
jgi:uncharacterized protein (TIGR03435 family)